MIIMLIQLPMLMIIMIKMPPYKHCPPLYFIPSGVSTVFIWIRKGITLPFNGKGPQMLFVHKRFHQDFDSINRKQISLTFIANSPRFGF